MGSPAAPPLNTESCGRDIESDRADVDEGFRGNWWESPDADAGAAAAGSVVERAELGIAAAVPAGISLASVGEPVCIERAVFMRPTGLRPPHAAAASAPDDGALP